MIAIGEARQAVLDACAALAPVLVPCDDMAGRVLAQDVVAIENVPPFANSAVDGYAVRADDVAAVPVELRVVGTVAAGAVATVALKQGEAMRIMTGASIPSGADAVVMVEDSQTIGEEDVRLTKVATTNQAIREVVRRWDAAWNVVGDNANWFLSRS